jgi:hypothetical protein
MMTRGCLVAVVLLLASGALAQDRPAPIQDNSFLIEEAYNQERGVVQHIATFDRARGGAWSFGFTQEWPVPDQRHQLSYVVPVEHSSGGGLGDVAINYRYQLVGGSPLAVSPRLSVLLPTGNAREGRGAGSAGVQVNLPVSLELGSRFVTHANAGFTHVPSARGDGGARADATAYNLGQSLIWLATPTVNFMLELAWARDAIVVGDGATAREETLLLAPGMRGAINLSSGMQIVPGIAVPLGIVASDGERSLFFYLSVEHAFRR